VGKEYLFLKVIRLKIKRINSDDKAFIELVTPLDEDLAIRDGEEHPY